MTLDPRVSMWLNVALIVLMAMVGCASMFTDLIGPVMTVKVMAVVGIASTVINAVLHGIPSRLGAADQFPLGPK